MKDSVKYALLQHAGLLCPLQTEVERFEIEEASARVKRGLDRRDDRLELPDAVGQVRVLCSLLLIEIASELRNELCPCFGKGLGLLDLVQYSACFHPKASVHSRRKLLVPVLKVLIGPIPPARISKLQSWLSSHSLEKASRSIASCPCHHSYTSVSVSYT